MPTYPPVQVTTATLLRAPSSATETQFIQNVGTVTVYLGQTSGVTTSTGMPLPPGGSVRISKNATSIYAVASATAAGPSGMVSVSYGANP